MRTLQKLQRAALVLVELFLLVIPFSTAQADATAQASAPELAEVVVTAQRRSQDVQDVPMSIVALEGGTLQRANVMDFGDYAAMVPNLSFSHAVSGQFGSLAPVIRGVYGPNTTAFYIDETPVPDLNPRAMDLARIEVLRGPQGTLYGAESMGGTIRLITKAPNVSSYEGAIHGTAADPEHGTFDYDLDGDLNVPLITGTAALRLFAFQQVESGLFTRVQGLQPVLPPTTPLPPSFSPHQHVDGQRIEGGSATGVITLQNETLTIRPRVMLQHWQSSGLPYADVAPGNFTQVRLFNLNEPGWDDWQLYSLTINKHLPAGNFLSSTALLHRSDSTSEDYSEVAMLLFGIPPTPALMVALHNVRSVVQEFRFTSDFSGPLQLTAGLFYSNQLDRITFPNDAITGLDALLGGGFGTDVVFSQYLRTTSRQAAVYGELTYALTSKLSATVGARAFDNSVDFGGNQFGIAVATQSFAGREEGRKLAPKVSLAYKLRPNKMMYATAAQGYRLGGVNSYSSTLCAGDLAAAGLSPNGVLTYQSDKLWNYELGTKTSWLNRRLTANGDVFYIDWSNVQQLVPLPTCGFFVYVNAGKAYSKGAEFQVQAAVTDSLIATVGLGYTTTRITDNGGLALIQTGVPLQQVPKWSASASAEYRFEVLRHPGFARVDYSYTGQSFSENNSTVTPLIRPSYNLVNLNTGLTIENLEIGLFVKNVANTHANFSDIPSVAIPLPGRPRIVTNRPRTIGLDLRYVF